MDWTSYSDQFYEKLSKYSDGSVKSYSTRGGQTIRVPQGARVDTSKERNKGDVTLADVMVHSSRGTSRWLETPASVEHRGHYGRNHTRFHSPSFFVWIKGTNKALTRSRGYRILPIALRPFFSEIRFDYDVCGRANKIQNLPLRMSSGTGNVVPRSSGETLTEEAREWIFYPVKDGIVNPNQRLYICSDVSFKPFWSYLYDLILGVRNPYSSYEIQRPSYWIGC